MNFTVAATPNIETEYSDQWETIMVFHLVRDDGTEGDAWIVAGVPDYQQGTALAAASGRESVAASAYPGMMTVRWADFGSWDAWCGFERPDDDDESREVAESIVAAVQKLAMRIHVERLRAAAEVREFVDFHSDEDEFDADERS